MTSETRRDPLAELSARGVAVWLDDLSTPGSTASELDRFRGTSS
jgi:hypothetical protein